MYRIIRRILFICDPEWVHYFSMNCFKWLCYIPFIRKMFVSSFTIDNKQLTKELFGLHFKNLVGLAAGFDKNARYLHELETLGFGCMK